ncbi:MAG: hypothetical protein LBL26_08285, partial [Peptococcaceae bacterium]|nr:hypothetical protein [Peptococcaceae bacterium]
MYLTMMKKTAGSKMLSIILTAAMILLPLPSAAFGNGPSGDADGLQQVVYSGGATEVDRDHLITGMSKTIEQAKTRDGELLENYFDVTL